METTKVSDNYNPFRLGLSPKWLSSVIEKALSLDYLAKGYDGRPKSHTDKPADNIDAFMDYTLETLGADLQLINAEALKSVPKSGPTVFVSNHPLGGIEGVLMTKLLKQVRPDLKVLTNELLSRIPEYSDLFVGVDVLAQNAAEKNARGVRDIVKHLRRGGALLIYPAGQVSAIDVSALKIRDRQWNPMVGRLVQQFKATCVPFFVHGRNSRLFYASGLIHKRLRTMLLPRELAHNSKKTIPITVGDPVTWQDMRTLQDEKEITQYLRTASDLLAKRRQEPVENTTIRYPELEPKQLSDQERANIVAHVDSIADGKIYEDKQFDVYCVEYAELGPLMKEIAYARERTFRLAGEGTGELEDSDRYDPHYRHMFVWDREQLQIVGGYRLGEVDKIVSKFGVDGLYSRSLYKFSESYLNNMDGALEMGRSFVTPEYQRNPKALDLLWRGIGAWVVKNPQYATLFGCVSISQEHSQYARAFLKESLMHNFRIEQESLADIKPAVPLKVKGKIWGKEVLSSLRNVVLINKLLGQCDPGKSIPVLLRQYLALNGRFGGFSVNRGFNDSLDGLIFVDLRKMPTKYLHRYLGKEGGPQFLEKWGMGRAAA